MTNVKNKLQDIENCLLLHIFLFRMKLYNSQNRHFKTDTVICILHFGKITGISRKIVAAEVLYQAKLDSGHGVPCLSGCNPDMGLI